MTEIAPGMMVECINDSHPYGNCAGTERQIVKGARYFVKDYGTGNCGKCGKCRCLILQEIHLFFLVVLPLQRVY